MITTLLIVCGASLVLTVALLAIVMAGIKQEPPTSELSAEAPRFIASRVRRLLGVYVRRPEIEPDASEREIWLAGTEGRVR
jgi:hypothetical protein